MSRWVDTADRSVLAVSVEIGTMREQELDHLRTVADGGHERRLAVGVTVIRVHALLEQPFQRFRVC